MTKADQHIQIKEPEANPIVTMITPGRRALGEDWSRVDVSWDGERYITKREDAPRPADGNPIFVPGLGNLSVEMMNFVIAEQQKEAEYRQRAREQGVTQKRESETETLNRLWHDYIEAKVKALKGQSQFGPGGHTQREKVTR